MELRIYFLRKLTFTGNQTLYENFILRKFGAIRYYHNSGATVPSLNSVKNPKEF